MLSSTMKPFKKNEVELCVVALKTSLKSWKKLQNNIHSVLLYMLKNKTQSIYVCIHVYRCKCKEKRLEVYTPNCSQQLDFGRGGSYQAGVGKNGAPHLLLNASKELSCLNVSN